MQLPPLIKKAALLADVFGVRSIPAKDLKEAGYPEYVRLFK